MISFIEDHRDDLGVEPICNVLPIAQSTFYAHAAIIKNPDLASGRVKQDAVLSPEIKRVWEENNEVYGIRKIWHQLQRENFSVARCTVCLLYTSDAADDLLCVDLGGRRIIKKKK